MGRVSDSLIKSEPEEGDACPIEDCTGKLHFPPVKNCSCHISPPCDTCITNPLTCNTCGEEFE